MKNPISPMRCAAALLLIAWIDSTPASAAGKIYYGSRAGMHVSVVSVSGLDTARAVIRTKHTREDATAFCREYVGKVTSTCVKQTLDETRINDEITGDCTRGTFVDFRGYRYRFDGPNKDPEMSAKYRIVSVATGEVADGSSASGYDVAIDIYKALCPSRAPQVR
jgi:hypothetical protein